MYGCQRFLLALYGVVSHPQAVTDHQALMSSGHRQPSVKSPSRLCNREQPGRFARCPRDSERCDSEQSPVPTRSTDEECAITAISTRVGVKNRQSWIAYPQWPLANVIRHHRPEPLHPVSNYQQVHRSLLPSVTGGTQDSDYPVPGFDLIRPPQVCHRVGPP
nr:hypothetical protein [Providencia rettgeri]